MYIFVISTGTHRGIVENVGIVEIRLPTRKREVQMSKEPSGKYKYHLNVQLTPWEHENLEKFCTGHGTKNKLVRALLHRFFTEQGVKSPIQTKGVAVDVAVEAVKEG
jgi:hypothetical protein